MYFLMCGLYDVLTEVVDCLIVQPATFLKPSNSTLFDGVDSVRDDCHIYRSVH